MAILVRRGEQTPRSSFDQEEIAAGGQWVAFGMPDPDELVAEIRAKDVRSLHTYHRDLAFLREVPQLEFLTLSDPQDVAPVHDLPRLRSLSMSGTWGGRLDFTRMPNLRSFWALETPKDGGGIDTLRAGHPSLESLAIGRNRSEDLTPFAALRLRSLGISGGLRSLDGASALAETLVRLSLDSAPNLVSLAGIDQLQNLQVVQIDGLRHITTVEWAARLPNLRLLDVFDQKAVESLGPLRGHPSLEFITFGRVKDLDLEPLTQVPHLKLILTGPYRWNRDLAEFPYMHNLPADHPARAEYYALALG